jgi:acyl-CoA synthetase (AMP-forming)/AMP-acid ligase II
MIAGKVAKWWLPDDVLMLEELPHTATGKLNKLALRARYRTTSSRTRKRKPEQGFRPSRAPRGRGL